MANACEAKGNQLKLSVTAASVAGKATDHMVRFLAKEFGVAINDIEVVPLKCGSP